MPQGAHEDGALRSKPQICPRGSPASNVLHRHCHRAGWDLADVAVCAVVQSGEEFGPLRGAKNAFAYGWWDRSCTETQLKITDHKRCSGIRLLLDILLGTGTQHSVPGALSCRMYAHEIATPGRRNVRALRMPLHGPGCKICR